MSIRTVHTEFPDYDDELLHIPGFVDNSWHNDVCPKLSRDLGHKTINVWCDYKDPTLREFEEIPRFAVWVEYPDGCSEAILETDNPKEAIHAAISAV